ncbi:glycerophosphodiester phosphodiesterase [Adhaeribacter arboris]|uniref:Glycerophosphodiester phosphodiesterase n=1 Tax=Adhaeribacter arboris TaxID=2072846 RepID=A0A2T2YN76_9BACT|nr:glycerophosphodiester phosphodiesterase family protein [Adhaeribacter arboris]PSR56955.1 glycerophosphodiester phosphodiesterase [Adhaeribacter arboris]
MMILLARKLVRNSCWMIALLLSFTLTPLHAQTNALHIFNVRSSQDLHAFFKYTGQDIPLISGHRGGTTKGFPENCIATFENTLRYTPAFFEIDPRLTKDSVIVLMHDATLDRTTTGSGKVADYTWAELKKLKLKDAEGKVTPYGIPTLDEVIEWSKGKTIINLDRKDVPLAMTARKLREHQAEATVMLTVHSAEQAKFYLKDNKNRMFSAFIRNKTELADYEKAGIPWTHLMAYVGPANKPENKEMYDLLHARGVMCMISAAPSYDKLPDPAERKKAYQAIIQLGADVIESDLPIEAAAAVQPLLKPTSAKAKYFGKIGLNKKKAF